MATPNIFQQAKQAIEMRNKVKKIQKDLESQTCDYENAGVKVTVRGDLSVSAIKIDPEVVDITRLDKLERTIMENTNKALKKTKDQAAEQMKKMSKEIGLDGLMGGM